MISDELMKIIEELKKQGKMYFLEATTAKQIEEFENDKKIQLPEKYKEWLLYSDGGDLYLPAGVQLYGVTHNPIIDVNDDDRPDNNYIVIGALASGDPVLFEKNSEKIIIYDHESGIIDDELVYDDLYAFLKDLNDLLGIGE